MSKKEGIERLKMGSSWNQVWFASQKLTCIQKGCDDEPEEFPTKCWIWFDRWGMVENFYVSISEWWENYTHDSSFYCTLCGGEGAQEHGDKLWHRLSLSVLRNRSLREGTMQWSLTTYA